MGIPADKILTVVNERKKEEFERNNFRLLLSGSEADGQFTWSETAMVYYSEVYEYLDNGGTLAELVGSGMETDHRVVGDEAAVFKAAKLRACQRLAGPAVENLNQVFAALFGTPALRLTAQDTGERAEGFACETGGRLLQNS